MIQILLYNDLEYGKLKKQVEKVIGFLKEGDFKSADVKKMVNTGYYRAKLDDTNRLLFKYAKIENKTFLLVLEVIHNHAYEKSRFLNGAEVDESKLPQVKTEQDLETADSTPLAYVNEKRKSFHILDKILSFDEIQDEIFQLNPPLIIIGSAGSGKTALTLEKMKTMRGRGLYTTLSPYLVENSQNLYYSYGYENDKQEIDFLSFQDYLGSIEVPAGKEIDFRAFEQWIWRFKQSHKIKDAYKIYEEFKGVMTGSMIDKPYLSKADYLNLGVKQSIFLAQERELIYDLFTRYLDFLKEGNYYDSNLVAYDYLQRISPAYDFAVIDEVQDITNVQLYAILKALHQTTNFVLCGDSNQIVHPNFFSWANIKTLFYKQELKGNIIRVLATNYRNTPEVTHIANQLLLIKNARFGSIDRESTFLVKANSQHKGEVQFYENLPKVKQDLNQRTRKSANFAVIVMRNEDKDEARKFFNTPLLFSIHEVKGLEYENIILYNIISNYEKEFRELTAGVGKEDIASEEIAYSRAKDKTDKALDEYKFYVNSLYVAITRAIKNLYVVETNKKHALLELLGLTNFSTQVNVKEQISTSQDWQKEARRLELQGKQEQADAIRENVLQIKPVPWTVITKAVLKEAQEKAFDEEAFNKKAKDIVYEYALFYGQEIVMKKLSSLKYRPADADRWKKERESILRQKFNAYIRDDLKTLQPLLDKHGLDFRNEVNLTPLMVATSHGAKKIMTHLLKNGAKKGLTDNQGRTALQLCITEAYTAKEDDQTIGQPFLKKKKDNINEYYNLLKDDSLTLKIKNRSFKVASHQAEYLMLMFMMSTMTIRFLRSRGWYKRPTFETRTFMEFFEGLSEKVVPTYRAKRSYLSSILGKNEINTDNKYSKKLWVRFQNGHYVVNPLLEIRLDDGWHNVYDLVDYFINLPYYKEDQAKHDVLAGSKALFLERILSMKKMIEEGNDEALNRLGEELPPEDEKA